MRLTGLTTRFCSMNHWQKVFWLCLSSALVCLLPATARAGLFGSKKTPPQAATQTRFETDVRPVLTNYCYGCHGEKRKGDLDLRIYTNAVAAIAHRETFSKVMKNLTSHEMPPEG